MAAGDSPLLSWILSHEEPFRSSNRLASLYSDFSASKASNPDGYSANIAAWQKALQRACWAGVAAQSGDSNNTFVIRTGPALAAALEKRGTGRPEGLLAVQEESLVNKHWYRREDFLQRKQSVYWKPWLGVQVPAAEDVFFSLVIRMGLAEDKRLTREGEFVILKNVEETSEKLLERVRASGTSPSQLIFSLDTFIATFKDVLGKDHILNLPEISILLAHLYRDKRAIDMNHSDKTGNTTIKFSAGASKTPEPIEETDDTIAHLRSLEHRLNIQIADLQDKAQECEKRAREALKAGSSEIHKKRALTALRTKKAALETLSKREASLLQVEQVLGSIDDAAGQKEIVKAMESSASVLEQLNKETGGIDKVHEIMDRVADGRANIEEFGKALTESATVDEDEVDEELEELLREQKPERPDQSASEPQEQLPRVPSEEPTSGLSTDAKMEKTRQDIEKLSL